MKKTIVISILIILFITGLFCLTGCSSFEEGLQEGLNNSLNQNNIQEEVTFLKHSKGKEFFNIVCEVGNIQSKNAVTLGDSLSYVSSNLNYGVQVETNKNDEINFVSMMVYQSDDYDNYFLSASRLEYDNSNRAEAFNWIKDNLGKEATTKIGDANFKLYVGANKYPVLEIYTDGNEQYQNEQLNKLEQ